MSPTQAWIRAKKWERTVESNFTQHIETCTAEHIHGSLPACCLSFVITLENAKGDVEEAWANLVRLTRD